MWIQWGLAARIIAQLIVMGSGMMVRAVAQAYRQVLANASKTGAAQEVAQNIRRAGKTMTETEARQILGVAEKSTWEEVLQKYDNLFEQNAKNGSFYLQSKVHRAKECLESVYQNLIPIIFSEAKTGELMATGTYSRRSKRKRASRPPSTPTTLFAGSARIGSSPNTMHY
nr:mitochondrial import inner membrane translocase subunit tim16-like [Ipomoea batatas]